MLQTRRWADRKTTGGEQRQRNRVEREWQRWRVGVVFLSSDYITRRMFYAPVTMLPSLRSCVFEVFISLPLTFHQMSHYFRKKRGDFDFVATSKKNKKRLECRVSRAISKQSEECVIRIPRSFIWCDSNRREERPHTHTQEHLDQTWVCSKTRPPTPLPPTAPPDSHERGFLVLSCFQINHGRFFLFFAWCWRSTAAARQRRSRQPTCYTETLLTSFYISLRSA